MKFKAPIIGQEAIAGCELGRVIKYKENGVCSNISVKGYISGITKDYDYNNVKLVSVNNQELISIENLEDLAFNYFQDSINPEHIKEFCIILNKQLNESEDL